MTLDVSGFDSCYLSAVPAHRIFSECTIQQYCFNSNFGEEIAEPRVYRIGRNGQEVISVADQKSQRASFSQEEAWATRGDRAVWAADRGSHSDRGSPIWWQAPRDPQINPRFDTNPSCRVEGLGMTLRSTQYSSSCRSKWKFMEFRSARHPPGELTSSVAITHCKRDLLLQSLN
ncbi:hypothetical protein DAEQUDRAFT_726708 [Daedalea quercina L-15889]|uniref:Uncharacterized protein n=1 Tax=Daedalea quercina L-15889 TaxID=1314783 RepID=A0A165QFS3_9APHY|nr:hypothetical protein DAEQUDRAFT_726708 [Daedalea quercina L-15889]